MKSFSKKILSIIMAAAMVVTMIPMGAFVAQAEEHQISTEWTEIASTDFTKTTWSVKSSSGSYYNQQGDTFKSKNNSTNDVVSWEGVEYKTDNVTTFAKDDTYGAKVRDGFLFMTGWNKDGTSKANTPITGKTSFKIDVEFSFYGDYTLSTWDFKDNTFIKLKNDDYSSQSEPWQNEYYTQCGYGAMYTAGNSENSPTIKRESSTSSFKDNYFRIASNNELIGKDKLCHYILQLSHGVLRAYIEDESGNTLVNFGSIDYAADTGSIKGIMLGATSGSGNSYYQYLAWKNITFYEGTETDYSPELDNSDNKYLFAYFTGNDNAGEKLNLAVSDDGYNWESLNGGRPVTDITNSGELSVYPTGKPTPTRPGTAGGGHVRDPYILRKHDGSGYYIVATDCASNGWSSSTRVDNTRFFVWELDSLSDIDSIDPWYVETRELMIEALGDSGNYIDRAWAPEAIWDEEEGKYMLFWSTGSYYGSSETTTADSSTKIATRMYYMYTEDFKTFTTPEVLLPHVYAENIDGNITYANGLYYLWYKDETSSKLGYATAEHANGPYGIIHEFSPGDYSNVFEGPEVYYNIQNNEYNLIADHFDAISFVAAYNSALPDNFSGHQLTVNSTYNMNHLKPRHGSVVRINNVQYNNLVKKFGKNTWDSTAVESGENASKYLVGRYFTNGDDASLDASGKKNHLDYTSVTMGDYQGKRAASFSGTQNTSYATINTSSMLSGVTVQDGITIDFNAYVTTANNARFFDWADCDVGACSWNGATKNQNNTSYVFMNSDLEGGVSQSTSGQNEQVLSGQRTTSYQGGWHRYTFTIQNGWLSIYVDGTLLKYTYAADGNSYTKVGTPKDITQINSALFSSLNNLIIGAAAWGADNTDRSHTFYLNDFRVYNRALSMLDVLSSDAAINKYTLPGETSLDNSKLVYYDSMEDLTADESHDGIAKHSYTKSVVDDTCANVLNIAGGVTSHNGSVENANYVDATSTDKGDGYTISFLYNPLTIEDGNQAIFNLGVDDTPWGTRKIFELCENGYLRFIWDVNSAGDDYIDYNGLFGDGLTANTWHHIAIHIVPTKEYDNIYCYIDGELVNQFSYRESASAKISRKGLSDYLKEATRNVYYGNSCGYSADSSSGRLDEFRIFSGIINIDEIIKEDTEHVTGLCNDVNDKLDAAIWAYENRMTNGTVYKNVADAYQAYVEVYEVKDAIAYGEVNEFVALKSLKAAKDNLVSKTSAMVAYDPDFETVTPSFANDGKAGKSVTDYKGVYYDSLLYSPTVTDDTSDRLRLQNNKSYDTNIYYPTTVIAYKSGKKMIMPIYLIIYQGNTNNRYAYNVYPTNGTSQNTSSRTNHNAYVSMVNSRWKTDYNSYWDLNWLYMIDESDSLSATTYNTSNPVSYYAGNIGNKKQWRFSNALEVNASTIQGQLDSSGNGGVGYADFQLYWQSLAGSQTGQNFYNDIVQHGQHARHIYVIDYQKLITAINTTYPSLGSSVSSYRHGGLKTDFVNMDNATSFNIKGYDYSDAASQVATVAGVINTRATAVTTDNSTSDTNYPSLKASLTAGSAIKTAYDLGASELKKTYTTTSVDNFITAYNNAVEHMAGLIPNNYNQSTAGTLSTALTNAYNALDRVADISALVKAYDKANRLLLGLDGKIAQYDKDSVDNLIAAVQTGNAAEYATSTAVARANYGQSVQSEANAYATAINNALNGLTIATAADTTAYEAAVETINNLDPDAYDTTSSITTAQSTANGLMSTFAQNYISSEGRASINVVDTSVSQSDVNDATTVILTALSSSVKQYNITADSGVSDVVANNGTYENDKATYGTKMTFTSSDEDTAWYLDINSATVHKANAFWGYGEKLEVNTIGDITVSTVQRTESNSRRIRIYREYYNDDERTGGRPIQFVNFVADSTVYALPEAMAFAYYSFDGYYINGVKYNAGNTVTINGDVDIIAKYNSNDDADCAVNASDISGAAHNSTVKYNSRVDLSGGSGTYAWVEEVSIGVYRPFYIGEDVSFLAPEDVTLKAVNKTTFETTYGLTLPAINLRKGGAITSGSKVTFNAQVVAEDMDDVKEYGILIGAPSTKGGYDAVTPTDAQLIIENSGQQEGFAVLRAKSTKLVGANQFSINVSGLPSGYIYRGYVIYSNGSSLQTVYSDVVTSA